MSITISILNDFIKKNEYFISENEWFELMKDIAKKYNFAIDNAEYKKNPNIFAGNMANFINIIRIAITGSKISPNLYCILNILGKEKINNRIKKIILKINH